jgi:hypothetical protein
MTGLCRDLTVELTRKINNLSASQVHEWMLAQLDNCYRIAASKQGPDRDGWLEDAAYFAAAIGLIEQDDPTGISSYQSEIAKAAVAVAEHKP